MSEVTKQLIKAGVKQATKYNARPALTGKFGGKMPHESRMPTPNLMDMERDPEYWARAKKKEFVEIEMSPDEYLEATAQGFGKTKQNMIDDTDSNLVKQYAKDMKKGDEFPKLQLDYTHGFGQEGRHRALAAKQAGFDKVPVVVTTDTGSTVTQTGMTKSPILVIDKAGE